MPREPHPSDWNRLFAPGYRRRGPVGLFFLISFVGCMAVLFVVGGRAGKQEVDKRNAVLVATQTPAWATAYAIRTATAQARTAIAQQPQKTAGPVAAVATAGNFRSAPDLVPGTVVGSVSVGDQVMLLENRDVAGHVWYRVRLTQTAGSLTSGTEGWISSTLLAVPAANAAAPAP